MSLIPILPIGRTITTDYIKALNARTVGNNLYYIQAHRETIANFEEGHLSHNKVPGVTEIAILFRYYYYSTTEGLPWSTFPDNIKDIIHHSVMLIFDQMICLSKANSLQMTELLLKDSIRITKRTNLKIHCWLLYFNSQLDQNIIMSPIVANDQIPIGKVFLKISGFI